MFDEFFGSIGEIYDSVDGFFDDLIGDSDVLDVVKGTADKLFGDNDGKGGSYGSGRDIDIDMSDTPAKGAFSSELDSYIEQEQSAKSADPRQIEQEWFTRLRYLAKNEVFSNGGI